MGDNLTKEGIFHLKDLTPKVYPNGLESIYIDLIDYKKKKLEQFLNNGYKLN